MTGDATPQISSDASTRIWALDPVSSRASLRANAWGRAFLFGAVVGRLETDGSDSLPARFEGRIERIYPPGANAAAADLCGCACVDFSTRPTQPTGPESVRGNLTLAIGESLVAGPFELVLCGGSPAAVADTAAVEGGIRRVGMRLTAAIAHYGSERAAEADGALPTSVHHVIRLWMGAEAMLVRDLDEAAARVYALERRRRAASYYAEELGTMPAVDGKEEASPQVACQ